MVVFPQGRIVPAERRPLLLESGAARLARRAGGATVLPVALRYEFLADQHPAAFISAGPPWSVTAEAARDPRALTAALAALLTAEADNLRAAIAADATADFRPLLAGCRSINDLYDQLLRRRPNTGQRP